MFFIIINQVSIKINQIEDSFRPDTVFLKNGMMALMKISFVEKSIKAIIDSGATGEIGDGKIFLYNCEEAYRIRTGETGPKSFN